MFATSATLKRTREKAGEPDKTSSTNNAEPPAKTPQAGWCRLRPKPKNPAVNPPPDKTKEQNARKQYGPGGG
ncbi:hypothetical protein MRX96_007271 [Rhipicephalus microplus]